MVSLVTVEHRLITVVPSATGNPGNYSIHTPGVNPITNTSTDSAISSFSQTLMSSGPNSSNKLADFNAFLTLILTGNFTIGAPSYLQSPCTIALFIVPTPINPNRGNFTKNYSSSNLSLKCVNPVFGGETTPKVFSKCLK